MLVLSEFWHALACSCKRKACYDLVKENATALFINRMIRYAQIVGIFVCLVGIVTNCVVGRFITWGMVTILACGDYLFSPSWPGGDVMTAGRWDNSHQILDPRAVGINRTRISKSHIRTNSPKLNIDLKFSNQSPSWPGGDDMTAGWCEANQFSFLICLMVS